MTDHSQCLEQLAIILPSLDPDYKFDKVVEGLVQAGMQVKRLLVNNMREITPDDARRIYQSVL